MIESGGAILKLIIADDEHRVCQLIENILSWKDYGVVLSGTAYNGVDAFQLIQDVKPDIVITDIRMPGYDGITLIEKSKKIDPDISFIIVSGHRDFEYAQRALKFGAEDYLLKPVSRKELEQIILRVIEKKNFKNEKHKIEKERQRELYQNREILRNQLAKNIIDAGCIINPFELLSYKEKYSVSFQTSDFQVIIFQLDLNESVQSIKSTVALDTILQKTESTVSSFLKKYAFEILCTKKDFSLIYILNVKKPTGLSFRELEHLHEAAIQKISEYGRWSITLCSGKVINKIELLPESYQEAEFAKRDRIIRGCGKILEKRSTKDVEEELRDYNFDELEYEIKSSIDSGDHSKLENIFLTTVLQKNRSVRIQNPDTVFELFRFSTGIYLDKVKSLSDNDFDTNDLFTETEKILSNAGTIKQISERIAELYSNSFKNILSLKRVKDYRPIRIAKEYIDKHYSENISLNSVAREVGFNPAYFSSLFKKETGINFKEYLLQKRIETAKQLLISENDSIMMISERVGYKDVRYFSKTFAKTVGIKPNMYRKIYG